MLDAFGGRSHKPAASKVTILPQNSNGLREVSLLGEVHGALAGSLSEEHLRTEGGWERCEQQACGAPKMHLGQVAVLGPN